MGQQLGVAIGLAAVGVKICNQVYKAVNTPVSDTADFEEDDGRESGQTYVVMCSLDYKRTDNPLTCSIDGKNMERLVSQCGVPSSNVTAMYDEQCTKDNVEQVLEQVGSQCQPGDFFVFYYSGHGTNLKDQSGDEEDGQDEAFCFVTPDGQISYESCMSDDDFADSITEHFDEGVKIVILTDCCHSGTIADFGKEAWNGRKGISITGCLDSQTSGDIGRGGIFTHSMLLAIGELQDQGEDDYSVGKLYNETIDKDDHVFNSEQQITLQCAPGLLPSQMAWPLVPQGSYRAPYNKRSLQ